MNLIKVQKFSIRRAVLLALCVTAAAYRSEIGWLLTTPTTFEGYTRDITALEISPDGKTLAVGNYDRTIDVLDMATHKVRFTLSGSRGVFFSPDGNTLASIQEVEPAIEFWDLKLGQLRTTLYWNGHCKRLSDVAFDSDGNTLAAHNFDTVRVWDLNTGDVRATFDARKTFKDATTIFSLALSPDGQMVATGDLNSVRLWDVKTGRPLATMKVGETMAVNGLAFRPDGKTLASGDAGGHLKLWDSATGDCKPAMDKFQGGDNDVMMVAISPNGKTLAALHLRDFVSFWDVASGQYLARRTFARRELVNSIRFLKSGKLVALGYNNWDEKAARMWAIPMVPSAGMWRL